MTKVPFKTKLIGASVAVLFVTMWNAMAGLSLAVTVLIMALLHYLRDHRQISRERRLLIVTAIAILLSAIVVILLRVIGA